MDHSSNHWLRVSVANGVFHYPASPHRTVRCGQHHC